MQELKYININGVDYKLGSDSAPQTTGAKQFTFKLTYEELLEVYEYIQDNILDLQMAMSSASDLSELWEMIAPYFTKSREELGLTDEVLASLISGETDSCFSFEAGKMLIKLLADSYSQTSAESVQDGAPEALQKLLQGFEELTELIDKPGGIKTSSMAKCDYALKADSHDGVFATMMVAQGLSIGSLLGGSGSSPMPFITARGLGMPASEYNKMLSMVGENVNTILGYYVPWGIGIPLDMLMGSSSSMPFDIPLQVSLEAPIFITEDKVIFGVGLLTVILLLFATSGTSIL